MADATYKGSLKLVSLGSGEFALDQNPQSGSQFAKAAQAGHSIQWVLKYQGELFLDGKRMSKGQAAALLAGTELQMAASKPKES